MPVLIAMLRAVNVGGHSTIKMEALRNLFATLNFEETQTYLQSGNVVFKSGESDLNKCAQVIQRGIEKQFACRPEIILRTVAELRSVVAQSPFAGRRGLYPAKNRGQFSCRESQQSSPRSVAKKQI